MTSRIWRLNWHVALIHATKYLICEANASRHLQTRLQHIPEPCVSLPAHSGRISIQSLWSAIDISNRSNKMLNSFSRHFSPNKSVSIQRADRWSLSLTPISPCLLLSSCVKIVLVGGDMSRESMSITILQSLMSPPTFRLPAFCLIRAAPLLKLASERPKDLRFECLRLELLLPMGTPFASVIWCLGMYLPVSAWDGFQEELSSMRDPWAAVSEF